MTNVNPSTKENENVYFVKDTNTKASIQTETEMNARQDENGDSFDKAHLTVELNAIQCPNEDCDYEDDSISWDNIQTFADKVCPSCGTILVPEDAIDGLLRTKEALTAHNQIFKMMEDMVQSNDLSALESGDILATLESNPSLNTEGGKETINALKEVMQKVTDEEEGQKERRNILRKLLAQGIVPQEAIDHALKDRYSSDGSYEPSSDEWTDAELDALEVILSEDFTYTSIVNMK